MAVPRFFDRACVAAGQSLSVSRVDLDRILGRRSIAIRLGPECRKVGNSRWIAELLVNVLARFYPKLALSGDDQTMAAVSGIARSINPLIEFLESESGDVTVGIGLDRDADTKMIVPSACGWVSRLSLSGAASPNGPANPYSSSVAVAFAAAEIFRRIFGKQLQKQFKVESSDYSFSLLDHGKSTGADMDLPIMDFGQVAMIGIGAVANPALWALSRHQGLTGELWQVDPDSADAGNLQRYVLAMDADEGAQKVALGMRELAQSALVGHAVTSNLEAFAEGFRDGFSIPTICVSVDNIEGRRQAQSLLPRLLVNGGTGPGNAGASWHRFDGSKPCLCCVYHPGWNLKSDIRKVAEAFDLDEKKIAPLWLDDKPLGDQDFELVARKLGLSGEQSAEWRMRSVRAFYSGFICGAVSMDLAAVKKTASVPLAHQSVLAGGLMAAELVKRSFPGLEACSQRSSVFQCEDVRNPVKHGWIKAGIAHPISECICQDADYRAAHVEKWGLSPS